MGGTYFYEYYFPYHIQIRDLYLFFIKVITDCMKNRKVEGSASVQ